MTKEQQQKLHKILGTVKYHDETWEETLERCNKDGGVDTKTLQRLLGVVLDILYGSKKDETN